MNNEKKKIVLEKLEEREIESIKMSKPFHEIPPLNGYRQWEAGEGLIMEIKFRPKPKPKTDWSKVKEGARVIVKPLLQTTDDSGKRHFAMFCQSPELVGTYSGGRTAWTNNDNLAFWSPDDVELMEDENG